MERKGKHLKSIMAVCGLLVLIFDSKLALEGARSGLEMCIKTVIPSLFPFFVLSLFLTSTLNTGTSETMLCISKKLKIPQAAASVLIPSILGGYPVGAKCLGDLYRRRAINRKDAERLLSFCNNAGPSFLFGMVSGFFPDVELVWRLWLIHLLSAAATAWMIPIKTSDQKEIPVPKEAEKPTVLPTAAKAMCLVCCWVILFRTILSFLKAWFLWLFPDWMQVLVMGFLELTNGCCELMLIGDVRIRFILCSCMLAFGGVCVILQTASVIDELSIRYYVRGKLIQTAFSFLLSYAFMEEYGILYAGTITIFVVIVIKTQNRYRNIKMIPV